jgi:poly(A) polymerase
VSLVQSKPLPSTPKLSLSAKKLSRDSHNISRKSISKNALKVLYTLRENHYDAYLVGGGVRDLLLGREPKDFDVVTNANPLEIKKCFKNGRLIGRRFLLVHVLFRNDIVEVSTFRAVHDVDVEETTQSEHGIILEDNVYGTIEEDAIRRDFTINALYYNIADFSVLDFHNGLDDLKNGILRVIGDPNQRFREDPVRMLRAIRFAVKLGFRIEKNTELALGQCKQLLAHVSKARLFNEILKLFMEGHALESFKLLNHYNLLTYLFPLTDMALRSEASFEESSALITHMLENMDQRIKDKKTVTPAFFFAVILWTPLQNQIKALQSAGESRFTAFHLAANEVIHQQRQAIAVPQYFMATSRVLWELQEHFGRRRRNRVDNLILHSRFRAALDFLLLRASVNHELVELANWWQAFVNADEEERKKMRSHLHPGNKRKRKRKRT